MRTDRLSRARAFAESFAAASALIALAIGWSLAAPRVLNPDLTTYHEFAARIASGDAPYRDFALEYPPGALVAILLPFLLPEADASLAIYGMAFLSITAALLVFSRQVLLNVPALAPLQPPAVASRRWMVLALLLAPLALGRLDAYPMALFALGLAALLRLHSIRSGTWMGAAILAKLYPVAVLPILAAWLAARVARSSGAKSFAASGLVSAGLLTPLALGAQSLSFLTFHAERGLHVESLAGGLVLLADVTGLVDVLTRFGHNSWEVDFGGSATLLATLPILAVISLLGVNGLAVIRLRDSADTDVLIDLLVAGLLLLMLTSKVFSPQYLVWLLPVAPWLPTRWFTVVAVACALTILIFPLGYDALLAMEPIPVLLLNARNGLLAFVALSLIWKHAHTAHASAGVRPSSVDASSTPAGATAPVTGRTIKPARPKDELASPARTRRS